MEIFSNFYISCSSFFLLDRPFLLQLILKIRINYSQVLAVSQIARKNYFSKPSISELF